jgi:hypothetical protein
MRKILSLSVLLLAITFVIVNCTKEGPAGPAGPAGPQGNAGLTGPAGPAGTANVIYSPWFAVSTLTPLDSTHVDYGGIKRYIRTAPGVTAAIIDNGLVLSYWRVGTGTTVPPTSIPFTLDQTGTYYMSFWLNTGRIFYFTKIFGTTGGWTPNSTGEFRYVIIPGGVLGGRTRDPRTMTYQEVCQAYGIPE